MTEDPDETDGGADSSGGVSIVVLILVAGNGDSQLCVESTTIEEHNTDDVVLRGPQPIHTLRPLAGDTFGHVMQALAFDMGKEVWDGVEYRTRESGHDWDYPWRNRRRSKTAAHGRVYRATRVPHPNLRGKY